MDGIISTHTYILIDAVLSFGGLLAFCAYQLWSVRRTIAQRRARERAAAAAQAQPPATGDRSATAGAAAAAGRGQRIDRDIRVPIAASDV